MRVAACAVIYRQGRVLLGKRSRTRSYYPGVWDLFGGHVEPGERPETAMTRELSEELGIEPINAQLVRVVSETRPDTQRHGEFHVYLVTHWLGEPRLKNAEHDQLGWFTLANAAALDLADPAILAVLEHAVSGGLQQL